MAQKNPGLHVSPHRFSGFRPPSLSDLTHASDDSTPADTDHFVTQSEGSGNPDAADARLPPSRPECPGLTRSGRVWVPGYSCAVVASGWGTGDTSGSRRGVREHYWISDDRAYDRHLPIVSLLCLGRITWGATRGVLPKSGPQHCAVQQAVIDPLR